MAVVKMLARAVTKKIDLLSISSLPIAETLKKERCFWEDQGTEQVEDAKAEERVKQGGAADSHGAQVQGGDCAYENDIWDTLDHYHRIYQYISSEVFVIAIVEVVEQLVDALRIELALVCNVQAHILRGDVVVSDLGFRHSYADSEAVKVGVLVDLHRRHQLVVRVLPEGVLGRELVRSRQHDHRHRELLCSKAKRVSARVHQQTPILENRVYAQQELVHPLHNCEGVGEGNQRHV